MLSSSLAVHFCITFLGKQTTICLFLRACNALLLNPSPAETHLYFTSGTLSPEPQDTRFSCEIFINLLYSRGIRDNFVLQEPSVVSADDVATWDCRTVPNPYVEDGQPDYAQGFGACHG